MQLAQDDEQIHNHAHSHCPHNFWSSYEYPIHC